MAISLDQQIQTKMDAYRGDPNKLMQRYQQSQELLDLLALQKLKSEKEAAARDMQMQMQHHDWHYIQPNLHQLYQLHSIPSHQS